MGHAEWMLLSLSRLPSVNFIVISGQTKCPSNRKSLKAQETTNIWSWREGRGVGWVRQTLNPEPWMTCGQAVGSCECHGVHQQHTLPGQSPCPCSSGPMCSSSRSQALGVRHPWVRGLCLLCYRSGWQTPGKQQVLRLLKLQCMLMVWISRRCLCPFLSKVFR